MQASDCPHVTCDVQGDHERTETECCSERLGKDGDQSPPPGIAQIITSLCFPGGQGERSLSLLSLLRRGADSVFFLF